VRELENLVQRLVVLKPDGDLDTPDLPADLRGGEGEPYAAEPSAATTPVRPVPTLELPPEGLDLYAVLGDLEDRLIHEALERTQGNKNQAARVLGLNRTTLVEKLRKMSRKGSAT
jgi:DNA-binding NtrC family response regulator